jgi:hypothetical protein
MAMNLTKGAARELIDPADVSALRSAGVLVEDPRRERPRYFDGRFLAARDLVRDQQYFLTREADLGRVAGSGVANGLFVTTGATPSLLDISAGQGVTPAGELVLLPGTLQVNLADVPTTDQLSASFGLSRIPTPPLRSRTGLYVLALRPVEFTANPIGAYPTTLTGPRTVEDGDVIEATAIVLVPWQDDGAADNLLARRGTAARTIFSQNGQLGVSANLLPVAMLALNANSIVWIDEAMVRRELGADRGDLPGLGFAPRALRLAHLLQYQTHLSDVVAQLSGRSFPAATQFAALPPAGPLPPGIINTSDFTQRYFPSMIDVDFSIIPDDELPALVEEALALPPIDFQASDAALDLTAIVVLAPVPRADFRTVLAKLATTTRLLKPAAPNLVAQRKPLEILQGLRLPLPLPTPDVSNPSDAEWALLAQQSNLWFVRRRNLAYRDDLVGAPVAVAGKDEVVIESLVRDRLGKLGLSASLDKVLAGASSKAAATTIGLLASPRIAASPALTAAALGALTAKAASTDSLDHAAVLQVSADLNKTGVGDGLLRLEQSTSNGVAKNSLLTIASGDAWQKLDATAAIAQASEVPQLATRLAPLPVITKEVVPVPVKPVVKLAKPKVASAPAAKPTSPATSSKQAAAARKAAKPAPKAAPKTKATAKRSPVKKAGK